MRPVDGSQRRLQAVDIQLAALRVAPVPSRPGALVDWKLSVRRIEESRIGQAGLIHTAPRSCGYLGELHGGHDLEEWAIGQAAADEHVVVLGASFGIGPRAELGREVAILLIREEALAVGRPLDTAPQPGAIREAEHALAQIQ